MLARVISIAIRTRPEAAYRMGKVDLVHYVIMGCGRVGSTLARNLEDSGHTVAVIDRDAAAFRRLPSSFEGGRVTGIGFDRETLEAAGIKKAYAFAAVSSGDNSNILAARAARETYDVEHVVARIYDPARAEIYQRLGIPTVATVGWTTNQVLRRLVPQGTLTVHQDPTGTIEIAEMAVHRGWAGRRYATIEHVTGARIAYVTRTGDALLPRPDLVHQEGDIVHVVLESARVADTEQILSTPPGPPTRLSDLAEPQEREN